MRAETVGSRKLREPRLYRQFEADLEYGTWVLFQTEIKNWQAHAISGKKLTVST